MDSFWGRIPLIHHQEDQAVMFYIVQHSKLGQCRSLGDGMICYGKKCFHDLSSCKGMAPLRSPCGPLTSNPTRPQFVLLDNLSS